jgi:hypothetical protein
MPFSAALVAALLRDGTVAGCAREAGASPQAYVSQAFTLRHVRLRGGEQMTVADGSDACLALGQSNRIFIFERRADGYHRVLSAMTMAGEEQVRDDGTVVLPTHETIVTIFESAYVWNGKTYEFSAPRSTIYDVPLEQRRPYQIPVRFAPGAYATTVTGSVAEDFGDEYRFEARAGQRITITLRAHDGSRPATVLASGGRTLAILDGNRWSGTLPRSGSYELSLFGSGVADPTTLSTYTLRLEIR